MAIKSGDVIGDYKVLDLVGSGGMGAVYKIEHVITKRIEAMKFLPAGVSGEPEEVQRFEREIQVQARLSHSNIAGLYNAVRDGQSIALIMEYVDGESLQHILERGRLPLHTAVDYAGQVLDALAYAHGKGVIHRDVTPANIIITGEGVAKLTDFGLARAATDLRLSTTGIAMGSPWYMSPEQVRALDELDARTDIYAMGAVLHEMLTGRKLFEADGSFEVMRAHMETVPQPPSACNPEISTALDEVVARALVKDPAARFQSAGEFRFALAIAMGGMQPSTAALETMPSGAAFDAPSRRKYARPSRAAIVMVLASTAIVAVICAVVALPHQTTRVAAKAPVPRSTVVPDSAPVVAPAPEPAAVFLPPDPPVEVASPAPRPPSPVRSVRRAADQNVALKFTGATLESPSAVLPPNTPHKMPPTPAETALKADVAVAPEASPAPAPSAAPAEPEGVAQIPEEAIAPKTGNRLMRTLGKINPFRKGAKDGSAEPAPKKN